MGMEYSILLIEDDTNFIVKQMLKEVEGSNTILVSDETTLGAILKEKIFHLIVLNTDICDSATFNDLFEKDQYSEIPILLIGKRDVGDYFAQGFLTFDCTNEKFDQQLFLQLINYCKTLYKKELNHESKIISLLYTDSLTQLGNRVKLIKDLQNDTIGIDALAIIDINDFKNINDFFGHRIGDKVLKIVAQTLSSLIEQISNQVSVYKLSSDVFCLANLKLDFSLFEDFVLYALGAIESQVVNENGYEINLRATAGISFSKNKNKLITADLALQEAKKEYKNYLIFYDKLDYLCEYEKNMLWAGKLKQALKNDDICVYYQPIVSSKTMKIEKYECLVRMSDKQNGQIISPHFFMNIAKQSSQYYIITKLVIENAFKQFHHLKCEFSINISFRDIEEKSFLLFIKEMLKKYDVRNQVVWEILEDEEIKDYDLVIDFIKKVKKLGCKVSLDDFGTGYSNFEHILKMQLDYLKIDATLVKMVVEDQNSFKIVKTIVEFAKSLNILTIAEYVENEDIFKITKDMGVDFFQGYYFSKPLAKPIEE